MHRLRIAFLQRAMLKALYRSAVQTAPIPDLMENGLLNASGLMHLGKALYDRYSEAMYVQRLSMTRENRVVALFRRCTEALFEQRQ